MKRKSRQTLPREIFLSHSSKDRRAAAQLAAILRDHGIPVWYSETNLVGAQQWHDEIGAALKRCDWFLILLSPHSARSRWVKRELMYALRDARYENHIVPIQFRTCDPSLLSWTLDDFQAVDLISDFDKGCRALLRTWGLGYKQPSNPVRRIKRMVRKR